MVLDKKRTFSSPRSNKKVEQGKKELTSAQSLAKKKALRVGDVCNVKITALAPNNIGIDEYSYPYAIFFALTGEATNEKIGSQLKVKLVKIQESSYAVGQVIEGAIDVVKESSTVGEQPVKPGDTLTVSIVKQMEKGNAGIAELANNFRLIVPLPNGQILEKGKTLENVKVTVTRVKLNYGFAKIEKMNSSAALSEQSQAKLNQNSKNNFKLEVGSKFTTTIPAAALSQQAIYSFNASQKEDQNTKGKGKFVVLNVNGSIVFLKLKKEQISNLSNLLQNKESSLQTSKIRVRIKITSKSANCAVGKILQLKPAVAELNQSTLFYSSKEKDGIGHLPHKVAHSSLSLFSMGSSLEEKQQLQGIPNAKISNDKKKKTALVLKSISEMINHGMHFGEKAVKCHARMKNYIWNVRVSSKVNSTKADAGSNGLSMTQLSKGKPEQERPLVKKGRHVINLLKTRRCLNQALNKLTKYALKGRTFLFIGTKKPAAGLVARASFFTKNSFYVNTRWLGGMLTNWKTICKSISKIRPILKEKQKVVRDILERRQAIKKILIKKAFLLKKKSKLILSKGRLLLETLKKDKAARLNNAKKLTALRNNFITKGMQYLERRQKLIQKRRELIYQTLLLKEKGLDLSLKHKAILNQLAIYAKKLREYKYLLILTTEINNLKNSVSNSPNNLLSVSYGKLKEVHKQLSSAQNTTSWVLPNPPKEILNKIVLTYLQQNKTEQASLTDSLITGKSENSSSLEKKQFIVCSTLLSKFSNLSAYIKTVIKTLIKSIQTLEAQAKTYSTQLNQIKSTLQSYLGLKQKYVAELQLLKVKFTKERSIILVVKRKLKALDAQKKLLKFLPRLRYLPTPQTKISEVVQILLARIVDPKLKYPIENIYDQKLSTSSKKVAAARKKKWQRLEKYFGGIANMTKLTQTQISRNVAIIIGQKEEMNAVRECQKLGIKTFTIVDSNCNPTLSDHIIPANDDSRSSIKYILTKFITRIRLAQKLSSRLSVYMKKEI